MLGQKGFEGVYTLIKSLEALPLEKQEEFLKSQPSLEGDVIVIRKGTSFALDVVQKAQGGSFTPEVAKKADEDTIGDASHATHPRGTDNISKKAKKSKETDLEKGEGCQKEERAEFAKDPEGEKEEHKGEDKADKKAAKKEKKAAMKAQKKEMKKSRKMMKSVAKFNRKFAKFEKSLQTQE